MPSGGRDIQDDPVYWLTPGGRCVCWPVRELALATEEELADPQTQEAYEAVAQKFGFCCLGVLDRSVIKNFYEDPGTFGDGKWKQLIGQSPINERAECWWVVVGCEESEPPRLLCRDFSSLLLELRQSRVATVSRVRAEKARRVEGNRNAVEILKDYESLWLDSGGVNLQDLVDPSNLAVDVARQAADQLSRFENAHPMLQRLTPDDSKMVIRRLQQAATAVQSTGWEAIRRERFTCTPDGLWAEITKSADSNAEICRGHASRQAAHDGISRSEQAGAVDAEIEGESDCDWEMQAAEGPMPKSSLPGPSVPLPNHIDALFFNVLAGT